MMTKPRGLISALLALLLGLALPQHSSAQQEPQRHYRIELIIVRHLAGSSDTAPEETLRDLSEILDLHAPAAELIEGAATSASAQTETIANASQSPEAELSADLPIAISMDDMSDAMRETWRRLRGSAGFRPELFRAWEQSGDSPFPQLRIHDEEILFTLDPAAQTMAPDVPVDEHGALVFSDASVQRKEDPGLGLNPQIEPPAMKNFYRIDGTAKLTRARLLNLDLDIELREALFELAASEPAMELTEAPMQKDPAGESKLRSGPAAAAPAFRVHRIQQRRQVKTEQLEYFDGPVIGILALITGFDVSKTAAEPEIIQP